MEDACHAGQKNYDHLEVGEWPTRLQRATTKEMEHYKSGNYYWSSVLPYGEGAKLTSTAGRRRVRVTFRPPRGPIDSLNASCMPVGGGALADLRKRGAHGENGSAWQVL
jgi:hypothetical protein